MIRTIDNLVEQTMTRTRITETAHTRPGPRCPDHPGEVLDGGDVQYSCPRGHRVQAADLNREVTQ